MPRDLVNALNAAAKRVLEDPTVRKRVEGTGALVVASTPEEFGLEIKTLYEQLKKVVKERGLSSND
jgi:tripartite-type tricarboxylate transporter receptor subunit TctC